MLDQWKRSKRRTQKRKFVIHDGRHVQEEGYTNPSGTLSLLLIGQFSNYRRSIIMLKRMLASLFALEMATCFLTLEPSLKSMSQGDDGSCCCGSNNKMTLPLLGVHCYSLLVLVENDGDPKQMMKTTEYAEVWIDWNGSMKWYRQKGWA
jgi:hypothetical protein